MREPRRCPRCGHVKFGICPPCFPELAEQERQLELAEWRQEQADEERRLSGMLFCPEHEMHDGCWTVRRPEPVHRAVSWQEAMAQLRRRYVSP